MNFELSKLKNYTNFATHKLRGLGYQSDDNNEAAAQKFMLHKSIDEVKGVSH